MKYTRKNPTPSQTEIAVTVDGEQLRAAQRSSVAKLAPNVKVAGFRKGKVPPEIAEKHLDQTKLFDEMLSDVVSQVLKDIITAEQLQLLDKPEISIRKFVPGELLEFTITAQIVPPVKLGDFRKLKVKQPPVKITDQDVREVVDNLLTSAAKKEPVKRAAENGDEVVLDFDGRDKENQPIAGAKATDYPLLLGSDSFIPGFEKGIIGHKAGEKFDLALTFPKDYQAKNLAGAKVTFKINLKRVLAVKKPTYDDKFAATIHPTLKTTADLEKDIRRELQARAEYDARQRFRNDLLAALVDKSSVDIPEILIDDQLKAMENNFQQNLSSRGQTEEDYLKSQGFPDHDDFIKRELRPAAEDRVKSSLVLAELSRSFGVEISQEEISARQKQVVEQYTDPKLRQQFESPEARREIANQLAIDQTLDKLAEANSKSTL